MLVDLWLLDAELGAAVAKQPWVIGQKQADDGNRARNGDRRNLETLLRIASADVELARLTVSVPWFVDGLTSYEHSILRLLVSISTKDGELARLIGGFPWFGDGSFEEWDAWSALSSLDRIASANIELAWEVAGLWLANGVSRWDGSALDSLTDLVPTDIKLARRIAALSWLADDVSEDELAALWFLKNIAASDIELARKISGHSWFADRGPFSSYVLSSLNSLTSRGTDVLSKLTAQPWFADGLDEEETALVVTLGWAAARSPELYGDLLRTHYSQYRAAALPMAGDVNI